jgi:hypothetical protein
LAKVLSDCTADRKRKYVTYMDFFKDSLIFSFGNSAASSTEQPRAWTPSPGYSTSRTRTPMSWKLRRRKTRSQWRRDQKRMNDVKYN